MSTDADPLGTPDDPFRAAAPGGCSPHTPAGAADLAEHVRTACIEAALQAWEDAGVQGLCAEGRWEAAVGAMRSLALPTPQPTPQPSPLPTPASPSGER